ncbi:MAG: hypothetical protein Tsb0032_19920 [Kiloniellaceae bacterium]
MPLDMVVDTTPIDVDGNNFLPLGTLVKHWADNPGDVPETNEGRMQALRDAGVTLPPRIKAVVVVHETDATLHIVCPPKDLLKAGMEEVDRLPPGDTYPVPVEYHRQICPGHPERPNRLQPNSAFLLFRVGEYCLGQCK